MKKIQKYITPLFVIFFFILLSIQQWEEYYNFHLEKKQNIQHQENISNKLDKFSLNQIKDIKNLSIYKTPNLSLLDQIVSEINNAQSRIFLETYILTETRIQQALKDAFKRWIDVQVILEQNPYMAYSINNKSFNNLDKSWIPVVWSDSEDYSFNHSKFIIIDNHFYISTWNYSYSTFKYNRDFFMKSDDSEILKIILEIYHHDYIWEKKDFYHPNIVLSPFNSRAIFEKYFLSAEKSIDLYFQYFKDEKLVSTLINQQQSWIQVTAIIPKTALDNNLEVINTMQKSWIKFHIMTKKKMHSKVIIIDKKYWFIWSVNFSSYSLDQNRELWLLIKNNKVVKEILDYFQDDIANNTVKK
jgi:phosphatidylserine/phosphatidylglycerophosphate/cardiolipin synthase-like enzyme